MIFPSTLPSTLPKTSPYREAVILSTTFNLCIRAKSMSADPKTFNVLLTVISSSSNAVNAKSPDTLILLKYEVPVEVMSPLKSPDALS